MEQKLTQLRDCFCKGSCKHNCGHCHEQIIDNKAKKARINNTEAHKNILIEENKCSLDKCQECNNILC